MRLVGGLTAAVLVCLSAAAGAAGSDAKPFGISSFSMQTTEPNSKGVNEPYEFTQAGGHPWALTSTIEFSSAQDPKDVIINLPTGMVANPQALARCSGQVAHCPTDSQVGVFELHFPGGEAQLAVLGAIVNMTPYAGQAAELGLEVPFLGRVLLTGRLVRSAQGYSLAIIGRGLPTPNLSSIASGFPALHLASMQTTLWGVPAAAAHDPQRGLSCFGLGTGTGLSCQGGGLSSGEEPMPFLSMPSNCSTAALTTVAWADSWEQPGRYAQAQSMLPAMAYCERLPFSPEVTVRPETLRPDEPVGVAMSIRDPQIEYASAIASTPPLSDATVTLPQGMSINPAVAGGLQACNATGSAGINIPTGLNASGEELQPGEVGPGEELGPGGEPELAPGDCPEASTVGSAEALTPLLAHPIKGRVYIATPGCGGSGQATCTEQDAVDGNLYRLYVELGGKGTERNEGVLIKLAATVEANPATGQLTVRLSESPQLPISELSLHLFGGDRALLANPTTCGPATTTSELQPWSAPYTPDASPSSYYEVTGCTNPRPFNPRFLAGSVNVAAGAFSPFTLSIIRAGGEQNLAGLEVHAPLGLSAMLSSVPLCSEALARTGECPEASRVGGSEVAAGAGSEPLYMPGTVYLTTGYKGAPFGLSIVTNAVAGPLNLGRLVIRARIDIDPSTAALTITTDPGVGGIPIILLGVPLRIQRVSLTLDRPHFIFNPTSCETQQITATIAGAQDVRADISNRFALADCASLAFKPKLAASTNAHTSFATGASLDVKLTFPKAEQGSETNLAQIKIALPRQLPSRLTTLQSACLQATFNANPAACPPASVVGIARAQTPMLPDPPPGRGPNLTGPVYFVTHGREAFPSPVVVLEGDGVRLTLRGSTIIDEAGIASVAFDTIPDLPLENLELYLPRGPHSVLSTDTALCSLGRTVTVKRKITQRARGRTLRRTVKVRKRLPASLPMGTELVAHNGAVIHQTTKITMTGCPEAKKGRKATHHKKHK
jgi:hypothetical protein